MASNRNAGAEKGHQGAAIERGIGGGWALIRIVYGRSWGGLRQVLGGLRGSRCPGCQGGRTATCRRSPPRAVSQWCTEGIARRLGIGSGAQMQPPGPEPLQLPLGALVPQPQTDGTIHTTSTGISLLEGMCTSTRHHCARYSGTKY